MSLSSISQLGQTLGNQAKEQTQIKEQISPNEADALVMLGSNQRTPVRLNTVKITERNLISSTVWDFAMWDSPDSVWNEGYSQGFILGNAISGVLGENRFGDPGTDTELVSVFNPEGFFKEIFQNENFIDTTTFTFSEGKITCDATDEYTFISTVIRKYRNDDDILQQFTRGRIILLGPKITGARTYISTDNGVTFTPVTNQLTPLPSGGEVVYKIDSSPEQHELDITEVRVQVQ